MHPFLHNFLLPFLSWLPSFAFCQGERTGISSMRCAPQNELLGPGPVASRQDARDQPLVGTEWVPGSSWSPGTGTVSRKTRPDGVKSSLQLLLPKNCLLGKGLKLTWEVGSKNSEEHGVGHSLQYDSVILGGCFTSQGPLFVTSCTRILRHVL